MRIIIFVLITISIYGLSHFYIFTKILESINLTQNIKLGLGIFLFLMVILPFISRFLERFLNNTITPYLVKISFTWMGFIFYVLTFFAVRDLLLFLNKFISSNRLNLILKPNPNILFSIILLSIVICIYAHYEASNIKVVTVDISNNKAGMSTLNIVQISDVHLGVIVREKKLKKIINLIQEINPDILLITGDLLDEDVNHIEELSVLFKNIKILYGKYGVTGNHEFYAGLNKSIAFFNNSEIELLRNRIVSIPGVVNIIGLDDQAAKSFKISVGEELEELVKYRDKELFTILLKHEPKDFKKNESLGIDLQLSGHTHNGQLFPFNLLVSLFYKPQTGLHKIGNSFLYISKGTGTWGPEMRFLAPPEVTWIRIKK